MTDHDTSVPTVDASLPEPNVVSVVDEDAPSANRHSFLDDIDSPLGEQDARSVGQDAPAPGAEPVEAWQSGQGPVPPTQIDVPPGHSAAPSTQDAAPPTGGPSPLDLEGLSRDQPDAAQDQGDASPGESAPEADQPSERL